MKKIILLLAIVFMSCEKDRTYCWRCENYSYISNRVINVSNYCDMTEKEIIELEESLSSQYFDYKCTRR